jgi:hypothetical protein
MGFITVHDAQTHSAKMSSCKNGQAGVVIVTCPHLTQIEDSLALSIIIKLHFQCKRKNARLSL